MKKIIKEKEFNVGGDYDSMYAAQKWLRDNGYDYGTLTNLKPGAIVKGSYYDYDLPFDMDKFTIKQMEMIHGIITGDLREGPVIVKIFE